MMEPFPKIVTGILLSTILTKKFHINVTQDPKCMNLLLTSKMLKNFLTYIIKKFVAETQGLRIGVRDGALHSCLQALHNYLRT